MSIKTLEVTLNPLALVAGWYQDSETGQWYYYDEDGQRYIYASGYLYAQMLWQPAPKVVNLKHGDTLRISVSFKYMGPAKTCKLYGSVGQKSLFDVFDEILSVTSATFTIPQSDVQTTQTRTVDIPITTAIAAGKYYGIYTKIIDGVSFQEGVTGSVALQDAVFVVAAEPTFSDFMITDYVKV
jgi:hypothetical protein